MNNHDLVSCVGAIVHDRAARLLLIQRGHEPGRGLWSIPGGRVEPGESEAAAVLREVAEETGLEVRVLRLVGRVRRPGPGGRVYDIGDYLCELADPARDVPLAGDDAAAARWVSHTEYRRMRVVPGMREALAGWDALPPGWIG